MQVKKLTRKQKQLLAEDTRLNVSNWLCVKETETEIVVVHKTSGKERTIKK